MTDKQQAALLEHLRPKFEAVDRAEKLRRLARRKDQQD
jgi:hypothetical protein